MLLTSNWFTIGSIDGWSADVAVHCICDILAVRDHVKFQCSDLNAVGMVTVNPGTFGDVVSTPILVMKLAGRLDAVVPRLAAVVPDVASPGSTRGFVELLNCNPGNASCVIVIGDTDVLSSHTRVGLIYGLLTNATGVDFTAVGLAKVAVPRVKGVDTVDGAALEEMSMPILPRSK